MFIVPMFQSILAGLYLCRGPPKPNPSKYGECNLQGLQALLQAHKVYSSGITEAIASAIFVFPESEVYKIIVNSYLSTLHYVKAIKSSIVLG